MLRITISYSSPIYKIYKHKNTTPSYCKAYFGKNLGMESIIERNFFLHLFQTFILMILQE